MFVKIDQHFLAYNTSEENRRLMHEFVDYMRKQVSELIAP